MGKAGVNNALELARWVGTPPAESMTKGVSAVAFSKTQGARAVSICAWRIHPLDSKNRINTKINTISLSRDLYPEGLLYKAFPGC
jgi:hypothetical protein